MEDRGRDRADVVHRAVAEHVPGYRIESVVPLGEGLDNVTYEVNSELIMRFSKEPDPRRRAARVALEARLLAAVGGISPLPVPEPQFMVAEQGCLAYLKLPGVPMLDVPVPQRLTHGTSIGAVLGELLAAMHAVPTDRVADLVSADDRPLVERRHEAAETYETVAGKVPSAHRRPVEASTLALTVLSLFSFEAPRHLDDVQRQLRLQGKSA